MKNEAQVQLTYWYIKYSSEYVTHTFIILLKPSTSLVILCFDTLVLLYNYFIVVLTGAWGQDPPPPSPWFNHPRQLTFFKEIFLKPFTQHIWFQKFNKINGKNPINVKTSPLNVYKKRKGMPLLFVYITTPSSYLGL